MGRDALKCEHKRTKSVYEDDFFMGSIYYGEQCQDCGKFLPRPPGPLELGTYK